MNILSNDYYTIQTWRQAIISPMIKCHHCALCHPLVHFGKKAAAKARAGIVPASFFWTNFGSVLASRNHCHYS